MANHQQKASKQQPVSVIGASGFVGNNLCRALLQRGYKIRALIHENSSSLQGLDIEMHEGDILNPRSLRKFLSGADVVFHAAGKISIDGDKDGSVRAVNVIGTKNVVEACLAKGISRLIYLSSIHALEQQPEGPLDETRPLVSSKGLVHDKAKSDAEREMMKGVAQGLDAVTIIPTAAIGPYDFQPSLIGQGLIALYNRKLPALIDGGFNWMDVRDIAKAAISAMEQGKAGERYVISGVWKSIKELAHMVQDLTGAQPPKFTSPYWLAKMGFPIGKAFGLLGDIPMIYSRETFEVLLRCNRNISALKARQALGFHPRPLKETLRDTFDWYKQNGTIASEPAYTH